MNLIGPSYNLKRRAASVQRTINLVPVPIEPGNERTAWVFKDAPGMVQAVADAGWEAEPPPAPVVESQTVANLAFSTSWSITAPSGIQAGDLLLALVSTYAGGQTPATTSTGWVKLAELNGASGSGRKSSLFAKIATGSDALVASVNPSSNTWGSYLYWRISGCDSTDKVTATRRELNTGSTSVVFEELTPAGGLRDRLWIAAHVWSGTTGATTTAFSGSYANGQQSAAPADTNRTTSGSARRTLQSFSEQPGNATFSTTTNAYQAWTIAVSG